MVGLKKKPFQQIKMICPADSGCRMVKNIVKISAK